MTLPPTTKITAICSSGSPAGKNSAGGTIQAKPAAIAPEAKRASHMRPVRRPGARR